jgi:pimeloyl-ACP methyl ester carboxylesterase
LALAALMCNFAPSPAKAQLRANKIPVLALVGELDPRKTAADNLNAVTPNVRMRVISKADHMSAPGNPEFIKALRAFLIEHSAPVSK